MNLFPVLLIACLSLMHAMDTVPEPAEIFSVDLKNAFTEKDLKQMASSASKMEIDFAVDYGMLPVVFSYMRKPGTAGIAVDAAEKAVRLCPKKHDAMIDAGMVEVLLDTMADRLVASQKTFDSIITTGLAIIRNLLNQQASPDWTHFQSLPYILEAVLFITPTSYSGQEYRSALEIFALLSQRSSEARTFLLKKPIIINRILARASFSYEYAIATLKVLARDSSDGPISTDMFKNNLPELIPVLENQLKVSDSNSRCRALSLIVILLDGPNFKKTKLFNSQIFPLIVKCLLSFQFDQIKYAFAIVSQMMDQPHSGLLYKLDDGTIMRGYLETLHLSNSYENFSQDMSFTYILYAISRLFAIDPVKAVKEFNAYGTHKGAILVRRLTEIHEEPDAQLLAVEILSYLD